MNSHISMTTEADSSRDEIDVSLLLLRRLSLSKPQSSTVPKSWYCYLPKKTLKR